MRYIKKLAIFITCCVMFSISGCNKNDKNDMNDLKTKDLNYNEKEFQQSEIESKQDINKTDNLEIKAPVILAFFISDNNEESENLIDNENFTLFNVIIGGGTYKNRILPAGNSVRIKVDIFNNSETSYEISVKEETDINGKTKLKTRKIITGTISEVENKSKTIEFVLKDIGCWPLIISANVYSGNINKETIKKIDFFCGE